MISDRKLWLTADKKAAVPDGHRDAAFLLCVEGGYVPDAEADRLGILGAPLRSAPETVTKAVPAPVTTAPKPSGSGLKITKAK